MFKTKGKKITMVAIVGALTLIAGGATLLASPAAKPPAFLKPCPNLACSINRECVAYANTGCTTPAGGTECNDSPPCSG